MSTNADKGVALVLAGIEPNTAGGFFGLSKVIL
jgi:hypothetical protein